jgi:hypothetical protein
MFVCCECCVLPGRGSCDGLITRPEVSYRLWHVVVCGQETSNARRLKPATGLWKIQSQWVVTPGKQTNKQHSLLLKSGTEHWRPVVVSTHATYSVRPRFDTLPENQLSFPNFLRFFESCTGKYLIIDHNRFFPRYSQLIKKPSDIRCYYRLVFNLCSWRIAIQHRPTKKESSSQEALCV